MKDKLRRELSDTRREIDAAITVSGGDLKAGIRVGFEKALADLPMELEALRSHGFEVDGGSYFLSSMVMSFVLADLNPLDVIHHPEGGPLLREYYEKARKL